MELLVSLGEGQAVLNLQSQPALDRSRRAGDKKIVEADPLRPDLELDAVRNPSAQASRNLPGEQGHQVGRGNSLLKRVSATSRRERIAWLLHSLNADVIPESKRRGEED